MPQTFQRQPSTTAGTLRLHFVIRGAVPIVDDIVMNGGLYPAEEMLTTQR